MKKSFCILLLVLLAGCAYTAAYLDDYPPEAAYEPQELLLEYESNPKYASLNSFMFHDVP